VSAWARPGDDGLLTIDLPDVAIVLDVDPISMFAVGRLTDMLAAAR
jgi:hypothetical protein